MSGLIISNDREEKRVTKEERRKAVLEFLREHELALPQKVIYRNLRLHYRIFFGYRTVDNYLDEFVEEGLCRRVDPQKIEEGEFVDAEENERGYYVITDAGREYLNQ